MSQPDPLFDPRNAKYEPVSSKHKAIRRKQARLKTKPYRDRRNAIKEFNGHEPRTF